MPFPSPNPNHSIQKFADDVTVYPHDPDGARGDSVYYDSEFGDPFDAAISIRPEDALPYRMRDTGTTDEGGERLIADVPADHDDEVGVDDSIDYDERAWRVTERQHANNHGFSRYYLVPDTRRAYGEPR